MAPALTLLSFLSSGFARTETLPGWVQFETIRGLLLGTPLGWNPVLPAGW